MEDDRWHDPLLITDASCQQQQQENPISLRRFDPLGSSLTSTMADPDDFSPSTNGGRSVLGFSLTSPDLVICAGSPDIPRQSYGDSPQFLQHTSIELSLENGIQGSEMKVTQDTPADPNLTEASFELPPPPSMEEEEDYSKESTHIMSINSGSIDGDLVSGGIKFLEDNCFNGGDTIKTEDKVGDGEDCSLYHTARFGNFSYHFKTLETGNYLVDLHLAEIVYTNGPAGMRVFDVFIQEKKVVSSLDIYSQVGANRPLVISDLKTSVNGDEGLSIKFEGVTGTPIVCGISIRKASSAIFSEVELLKVMGTSQRPHHKSTEDTRENEMDGEFLRLRVEYESQKKELSETKRFLEQLKRENQSKSRECQEALKRLQDLQNELMRKSMHVGSLAFAIEGQVKEKSRWFSSLRDLTRKLKIMKMDQIKLSEEALSYKKCMADMNSMSSIIEAKMKQQSESHEDLKNKFIKGAKERKELYNKILELKGNIRVFCRCRPLNTEETASGATMMIDFDAAKDGELTVKSNGASKKNFKFDAVFSPQADQADVFEDTAPFATSVLDGYNVCIFAYGQTGSGKTFTMEGTDQARGVNYRTLEELFRIIEERKTTFRYEISVSALEVYNEMIRDLLVSGTQPGATGKRLEVRQVGDGIHHVPGLVEARVSNTNEVWEVLKTGSNARAVGSTNANEHSSRSHCIHCVMVKGNNLLNGECTRSKLWLVDLAGSERIAKTEVQGERLKEAQNINRSLSALGDVISALATKSPHIPFRNSKLTHLLQDSLGGDSKTLMFVQISPNENDLGETLCSLNFASRVRGIELGPAKKQTDNTELLKYKQTVEKTKQEMKIKDLQIKKMEDTVHALDMKLKEKDLKNKNLQDKVKELESQLLLEKKLARQEDDQNPPPVRLPLGTRPLGMINNFSEKENNPEMTDLPLLPKRSGRASLCPMVRNPGLAPRRNSLIPLPLATIQLNNKEEDSNNGVEATCLAEPENVENSPPKVGGCRSGGGKNLSSILRRSLQKRMQLKSPMQQHMRRGVNVGMEKVRVSIGSRGGGGGRMAHRVLLANARRATTRGDKQNQREKERGWNVIGTAGKNGF